MEAKEKNIRKAAILIMTLEMEKPGVAKQILDKLGDNVSQDILDSMTHLTDIDNNTSKSIVDEFYDVVVNQKTLFGGSILTENLYAKTEAGKESGSLFSSDLGLFEFLNDAPEEDILNYFKKESYQLIAAIFQYLNEKKVSKLLNMMEKEQKIQLSESLVKCDIPNKKLLWKLHTHLKETIFHHTGSHNVSDKQVIKLARSLELMTDGDREEILSHLKTSDPDMAHNVSSYILKFEDLSNLPHTQMQNLLYNIKPLSVIAYSLQGSPEELKNKFIEPLSDRFLNVLKEEFEIAKTKGSAKEFVEAQKELLSQARKLEEGGKLADIRESIENEQTRLRKEGED